MLAAQPRTVGAGHPAWIVVPPFERTSMSSPRICRESCPWFETTEHPSVLDALTCLSAAWAPLMFTGSALRASGNSLNVIRARIGKDQCKGSFPSGAGGVVWGRPRATMWDVRGRSSITIAHMNQFICRSCFSNSRSNCVSLCDLIPNRITFDSWQKLRSWSYSTLAGSEGSVVVFRGAVGSDPVQYGASTNT